MRKIIFLTSFLFIVLITSCVNELESLKEKKMINVNLYKKPYFVCRDILYIDNNKNFTLTTYSIGTLASADKYIITGTLDNGKIEFTSSKKYGGFTLKDNYEILSQGDKPYIRFKVSYKDNWRGGYSTSSIDFQRSECEPGY